MNKIFLGIAITISAITYTKAQTLKQAIDLTNNEQYDEATKMYKKLTQGAPKNGENYYFLGENFFAQEMTDSANTYFAKGIELDPNNPLNYVGIGKLLWFAGKTTDGKTNFDKALAMNVTTKNVKVQKEIAKCYTKAETKDLSGALKLLDEATKIDPKNTETPILYGDVYLEQGDGSKAIEQYKKAQTLDTKSCLATLRIGQLYGRAKNYPLAFEFYQNAAKIDSSFAPAYREQAELYYKAGKYEMAKSKYKKFLELSSNNIDARRRYASFLFLSKNYNEAINQLNQVRTVDTTYNVVNRLLAFSYYEDVKYPEALVFSDLFFSRQLIEKNNIIADDYIYRGRILAKLGKDSVGITELQKGLQFDSTKTELNSEIASSYYKLKKYADAITYYEIKLKSKKGVTTQDYYNLGKSYYFIKNFEKADTTFGSLIKAQPELSNGYLWRAKTKTNFDVDSKLGLAKPFYETYITKVKDREKEKRDLLEAHRYLGAYYFAQKDKVNAKLNWEKVLELDPADEKAKIALKALN
jgi:tetratricopeptide (TPR) repeat protein